MFKGKMVSARLSNRAQAALAAVVEVEEISQTQVIENALLFYGRHVLDGAGILAYNIGEEEDILRVAYLQGTFY